MSNLLNIEDLKRKIRPAVESLIDFNGIDESIRKRIASHDSLTIYDVRSIVLHLKQKIAQKVKRSKKWWIGELKTVCFHYFSTFDKKGCCRVQFNFSTDILTENKMKWRGAITFTIVREQFPLAFNNSNNDLNDLLAIYPEFDFQSVPQTTMTQTRNREYLGCIVTKQQDRKASKPLGIKKSKVKKSGRKNGRKLNRKMSNIMSQLRL